MNQKKTEISLRGYSGDRRRRIRRRELLTGKKAEWGLRSPEEKERGL